MQNETNDTLVTARGTADGLVIRLKSQAAEPELISALKDYVGARKSFLAGNQVLLDWSDGIPADDLQATVCDCLKDEFDIIIKEKATTSSSGLRVSDSNSFQPERNGGGSSSDSGLFGGIDSLRDSISEETVPVVQSISSASAADTPASSLTNSMFWDNPDAMIVHATMRSGQKIETENSIVLIGDLNTGAEIVAAGDVIILGTMRGVVHAGAYDETGGGRFIFAMDMRPTQLRIGSIISRGAEKANAQAVGEIAYVDGNAIVVEKYNSRHAANRLQ